MFSKKPKTETNIQELIDSVQSHLFALDADSGEYDEVLKQLERLYKLQTHSREGRTISPDTMFVVLGNLAGIVLILNYERLGIVTSKAVGLLMKSKV